MCKKILLVLLITIIIFSVLGYVQWSVSNYRSVTPGVWITTLGTIVGAFLGAFLAGRSTLKASKNQLAHLEYVAAEKRASEERKRKIDELNAEKILIRHFTTIEKYCNQLEYFILADTHEIEKFESDRNGEINNLNRHLERSLDKLDSLNINVYPVISKSIQSVNGSLELMLPEMDSYLSGSATEEVKQEILKHCDMVKVEVGEIMKRLFAPLPNIDPEGNSEKSNN